MNCIFCHQSLVPDQWKDYRCDTCNVVLCNHEMYGAQTLFIRSMNNKRYCLNLFPQANITVLVICNEITNERGRDYKELVFNHNIPNVTPQNAEDKIKTLLVFS